MAPRDARRARWVVRSAVIALGVGVGLAIAALTAAVVVTDGAPTLLVIHTDEAPFGPGDERCVDRRLDPADAGPWRRQWRLEGEMSGMTGRFRGLKAGPGRGVVVWRERRWHRADVPGTMEGDWIGDGGNFHLFARGDVPFGFSFEFLDPGARELCELRVTAPLRGGNVTMGWSPATAVPLTALPVGDRADTTTRRGERFGVRRVSDTSWRFEITGDLRSPDYFRSATLRLDTDSPSPPWDELDLSVEVDGLHYGARGSLRLRPPIRCPNDRGLYENDCG